MLCLTLDHFPITQVHYLIFIFYAHVLHHICMHNSAQTEEKLSIDNPSKFISKTHLHG